MRRSLVLASVPLLMGLAPVQQNLPVRYAHSFACGFVIPPPQTLPEWRDRADLVIVVRIDSQTSFEHHTASSVAEIPVISDVFTAHEATVLTLIKGHPRAVVEGANQPVLQRGGARQRADHILMEVWNGFDVMPVGSEWVLFLTWDPRLDGFTQFYGEHGAVQIRDGKVAPPTLGSLHNGWKGRPIEEFLEAITR